METSGEISLASRLCLACGMCCDGTVHDFAFLQEDDVAPASACGFQTYYRSDGTPAMALPCHYLEGNACQRYDEWRPSICGDYMCRLQKRTAAGECDESEALGIIANAKASRKQVEELLRPGESLAQARDRFDSLAAAKEALTPDDAKLVVRIFVLDRLLDQFFRKAGKGRLPDAQARRA